MKGICRSASTGWLVAIGGTAAVAAFRSAIDGIVGDHVTLLPFVLSVTLSARCGGLKPGLLATFLGVGVAVFFFIPSSESFGLEEASDRVRLVVFLFLGVLISFLSDALITARRAAELNAEEANAKRCQLEEADRRKNEFLAALAHEIRNPLGTIRNAVNVAHAKGNDVGVLAWVAGVVDRQSAILHRFASDLSDLTRISQGKVSLNVEPLQLAKVLDLAVESVQPMLDCRGHCFEMETPDEPVWVSGDLARLVQVVTNLLANSCKYTPDAGLIRLDLASETDGAVIRVRDNGLGIPPEFLGRIFHLGEQVDGHLQRSDGGLGIGLAVVRRLVEMHGGSVEAVSEGEGRGCEFVVRLPRCSEDKEAGDYPSAASSSSHPLTERADDDVAYCER
jgi:signal transduction histidine kinase